MSVQELALARHKVDEEIKEVNRAICEGVPDWVAYRNLLGVQRGLRLALGILDDVDRHFGDEDDD
jgi:hypothetical protein